MREPGRIEQILGSLDQQTLRALSLILASLKGWDGLEFPKKRADFSGNFLVAGETGRWPGNNRRTDQCRSRQDAQVDGASRSGMQRSRGEGLSSSHPLSPGERQLPTARQGEESGLHVCVCVSK